MGNKHTRICLNCDEEFEAEDSSSFICPKCIKEIDEFDEIFFNNNYNSQHQHNTLLPTMRPTEIKKKLDEYVVGQDIAKKILATAAYNHIKRINLKIKNPDIEIDKSNVIIVGPSGCGKTHMIKQLAKLFDLPYCICDATTLTEAGYVGADVETILQKLYYAADCDISRAERGIVFIDEIDKKAIKSRQNLSITRDVSGESVQQALLKIIEGNKVDVQLTGERRDPYQNTITIDTTDILFIVSGAFPGIEAIIKKRITPNNNFSITIGSSKAIEKAPEPCYNDLIIHIEQQDLQKFGLIPEFVGRLPVVCPVQQLDDVMLAKVLTEPKNSIIKQYQLLMAEDGINLSFTEDAVREIAKFSIRNNTGARGLRTYLERILSDIMYNATTHDIVINKKYISEHLSTKTNSLPMIA